MPDPRSAGGGAVLLRAGGECFARGGRVRGRRNRRVQFTPELADDGVVHAADGGKGRGAGVGVGRLEEGQQPVEVGGQADIAGRLAVESVGSAGEPVGQGVHE